MIHLRSVIDPGTGDTIDHHWFCSGSCYRESLGDDPPTASYELGGAYPCGDESDYPSACGACGEPVGNPITEVGRDQIREWLAAEPGGWALRCAELYEVAA